MDSQRTTRHLSVHSARREVELEIPDAVELQLLPRQEQRAGRTQIAHRTVEITQPPGQTRRGDPRRARRPWLLAAATVRHAD